MTSSKYSREDRYKAAAAMVAHGNSLVVAEQTGIPASTLRHWHRNDEEFQSMCQEVWVEFGEQEEKNAFAEDGVYFDHFDVDTRHQD